MTPAITLQFQSNEVILGTAACPPANVGVGEEELERSFSVAFPQSGTYARHVEGERIVANAAVALFSNRDEVQRVVHSSNEVDRSVFVSFSPDFVEPFLHPGTGRFQNRTSPTTAPIDLCIRSLVREAGGSLVSRLEVEDTIVRILRALLRGPEPWGAPRQGQKRIVEDAKEYLGTHFSHDVGLRDVASIVSCSPHHLSRLFRCVTGTTLSEYRTQLRLRYVVDQVLSGADDLSRVAADAGFYDHAHMTHTMRNRLGLAPSEVRAGTPVPPESLAETRASHNQDVLQTARV